MLIRCWGSRGSIPVSGKDYIEFGGDTTCLEIQSADGHLLIVDAGSGIRRLGNRIMTDNRREKLHMFFTHAHWDHLLGFPFFKPIYQKAMDLTLYGCPFAQQSVEHMIGGTMAAPYFPVKFSDVRAHFQYRGLCVATFAIGSLLITPILLSHPNQGIGFKFTENGKSFVFLTDNELGYVHPGGLDFAAYREFVMGADLLIHDAEFTEAEYTMTKTWGHSTYNDAVRLSIEAGVKKLGMFHHNQDRIDSGVHQIESACRDIIGQRQSSLECFAVGAGFEMTL